jgi:hypothetical protein
MWINKKKYEESLFQRFLDGRFSGILSKIAEVRRIGAIRDKGILEVVLPELEELEKNTWDKDRVERIKELLIENLS